MVVRQVTDLMLDRLEHTTVAVFDADALMDYRSRRPVVSLSGANISAIQMPRLDLRLMRDELGAPFLFLSGFEPDFHWPTFTEELVALCSRLEVASTTWISSIPMPVPHTRPVRLSVRGNRQSLIDAESVWAPRNDAPAHVLHLFEYELTRREQEVAGLVLLVPHYLSEPAVPGAALTALTAIGTATGLILPAGDLRERDREFQQQLDEQIAGNEEILRLVSTLEAQHDAYLASLDRGGTFTDARGELPSADEIASELEQYLAMRREHGNDAGSGNRAEPDGGQ